MKMKLAVIDVDPKTHRMEVLHLLSSSIYKRLMGSISPAGPLIIPSIIVVNYRLIGPTAYTSGLPSMIVFNMEQHEY